MSLKVYFASGSPWAWRVMLAMVHKGLEFEMEELHLSEGDNKKPEYLALNPHGQVPVLTDGDFTLYESGAILTYLERKYPSNPLFGETAEEGALIAQRMLELEHHMVPILRSGVRPFFTGEYADNKEAVLEQLAKVPGELKKLEEWLGDKEYFFGSQISAVDLTFYPAAALMQRVLGGPASAVTDTSHIIPLSASVPKIAAWMQRIEAMPGFDSVYPTHWKQAA